MSSSKQGPSLIIHLWGLTFGVAPMYSLEIEPLLPLFKTLIKLCFSSHSLTDAESNRELEGKGQRSDDYALSSSFQGDK